MTRIDQLRACRDSGQIDDADWYRLCSETPDLAQNINTSSGESDSLAAKLRHVYNKHCRGWGYPGDHEVIETCIAALATQPAAPAEVVAPADEAESFLRKLATLPAAVIRSSRDLSPEMIAAVRAYGDWITLRDGLAFAIMREGGALASPAQAPAEVVAPNWHRHHVAVEKAALQMVRNALRTDAEAGRSVRAEMLEMLDNATSDIPAQAPAAPSVGEPVYLVATGETVDGQETYTRHEGAPPPLCDFERLFATPPAAPAAPSVGEPVTPALINSLPQPVRDYIHALAANTDPAGMVRENTQLRDTNEGLQRMYRRAADALAEVIGCFDMAASEGLAEALAETTDERLKDLVERRLMYAHVAAINIATPPAAPAATEAPSIREFLGKMVRAEWVKWAAEQPTPKASWLAPWDSLTEPEREVDRRIGEAIWRFSYVRDGATPPAAPAATEAPSALLTDLRAHFVALRDAVGHPDNVAIADLGINSIDSALAAPTTAAAVGASDEPVGWARPEDLINDGHGHSFTVLSHEPGTGLSRVPLYAGKAKVPMDANLRQSFEAIEKAASQILKDGLFGETDAAAPASVQPGPESLSDEQRRALAFGEYLKDCDKHAIQTETASAFLWGWRAASEVKP